MEEINIKEFLKYAREKMFIILISTFIIVMLGSTYMLYFQKPKYESYTTILLTKTSEDNTSINQNDLTINQKLVTTYREIIKSRRILKQVKKNLELDISIKRLEKMIDVSSVNDTEIIKIVVTNKDKELAPRIANEIANVFSNEIVELYKIQNIGIIDKAIVSNTPANINPIKEEVIFIGSGVIIGALLVLVIYFFDSSIRSIEEIENKIGLPIIGTIPLKNRKKRGDK